MKHWRALLVIIAIACFAVALSYPIRYRMAEESNNTELEELSAMRQRARESMASGADEDASEAVAVQAGDGEEGQAADGEEAPSGEAEPSEPGGETGEGQKETGEGQTEASEGQEETGEAPEETWMPIQTDGMWSMITPAPTPSPTPKPRPEDAYAGPTFSLAPDETPNVMDLILDGVPGATQTPTPSPRPTPTHMFGPTLTPSPTPDRSLRTGAASYNTKAKVLLDESKILPELKEIYALNHDLVGWIFIKDTVVDYPVVQTRDSKYYLKHDFYGKDNNNGQIILDTKCDPDTPSYNLIISGHHMNNGSMFGGLPKYRDRKYWESHKIVEFDNLMERKKYVIFAVFYSADYDEDETGFRYNADIQYRIDAEQWLAEVRANQVYDTGIDAEYGDEFITLTTCDRSRRRNGRFVAVGRRIRKGEVIK